MSPREVSTYYGLARMGSTYEYEFTLRDYRFYQTVYNFYNDISFRIPSAFQETKGLLFGHLPALGTLEYDPDSPGPDAAVALAQDPPGSDIIGDVVYLPYTNPNQPSSYMTLENWPTTPFWRPANFSATEVLDDATPFLGSEQIDYMTPSPTIQGTNYVWQSNTGLEPTFATSDLNVAASQSSEAFISGVAFGVVGAAFIAILQELPKRLKRRRKSHSIMPNISVP